MRQISISGFQSRWPLLGPSRSSAQAQALRSPIRLHRDFRHTDIRAGHHERILAVHLLGDAATSKLTFMLVLRDPLGTTLGRASATATLVPGAATTVAAKAAVANTNGGSTMATNASVTTNLAGPVTAGIGEVSNGARTATVTVRDDSDKAWQAWRVEIDTASAITALSGGTILSHIGDVYMVGNGAIVAHGTTSFSFQTTGAAGATVDAHLVSFQ
jgi:endoglucanase